MKALNKQALRMRNYLDMARKSGATLLHLTTDELSGLLDELEKEKGYASAYEGEKWHYHQLAESEGERANLAEAKLEAAEKRIAELEARPANPINFKESADADYCRGWAWNEVKKELSPEDWTVGDNCTYYGFFCWGWDSRRQFNEQRAAGIGVKGE